MKIAVASIDGVSVSPHFGRSACFIVFEAADGKIAGREVRDNTYTPHAKGECKEGQEHSHDQPHSHAGIIAALHDCQAVLCYGMGWRAAQDLAAAGVKAFILDGERTPEDSVRAFLEGKLGESKPFCHCHQ